LAALAVSVLGVGVTASIALPGGAEHRFAVPQAAAATVERIAAPGVSEPAAFARTARADRATRSTARPALPAAVAGRAAARDKALHKTEQLIRQEAKVLAAERKRAQEKRAERKAAERRAERKAAERRAERKAAERRAERKAAERRAERKAAERRAERNAEREAKQVAAASLPITSGYSVAARFGAVGSWSRYHTGFDFSAATGTTVRAPSAGVVTTAGSGSASGWAGTYVTIRHADSTSTLYAHLSSASVRTGERVSAGDVVGAVGQTGRSFGPHLHFEVYPAGVKPGDVYAAIDPGPWLKDRGVTP